MCCVCRLLCFCPLRVACLPLGLLCICFVAFFGKSLCSVGNCFLELMFWKFGKVFGNYVVALECKVSADSEKGRMGEGKEAL